MDAQLFPARLSGFSAVALRLDCCLAVWITDQWPPTRIEKGMA